MSKDTATTQREDGAISRRDFRRYIVGALIGYLLLASGVGVALHDTAAQKADVALVRSGLVQTCERVQVLRAQSNVSDSIVYTILSTSAKRELALAKADPQNRSTHLTSGRTLATQAARTTVTPLTDCKQAVGNPRHYVYPVAESLGDPDTGAITPEARKVVALSEKYIVDQQEAAATRSAPSRGGE